MGVEMTKLIKGMKFGDWTVKRRVMKKYDNKKIHYCCECKCGRVKEVIKQNLLSGKSKGCGCRNRRPILFLEGKKFGNWTVLNESDISVQNKFAERAWLCKCVCGKIRDVRQYTLIAGKSLSCGCSRLFHNSMNCHSVEV